MNNLLKAVLLIAASTSTTQAITLTENVAVNNLSATTGASLSYEIAVPAGASNLAIDISNGSGDADLYVRQGNTPTTTSYDCRPYLSGNNETCSFASPVTSTYFINVRAYSSFSGVSLIATYDAGSSTPPTGNVLQNNVSVSGLSGTSGSQTLYEIAVPANATVLNIITSGGSGDADLYVRYAAQPTTASYDCRPYIGGNNETCSFASPQTGTYYIMLHGYSAYSDMTLTASFSTSSGGGNSGGSTWSGFDTYYTDAIGQTGTALITALQEASARNHTRMTYSQVWDALKYTDEDPSNTNNVILIYTGRSQAKTFNASGNNDPDAWNREHSWPKSHGFPSSGDWGYTDIHHLRPADASVNSTRSNKDYDNGGSAISEAAGNFTDSDSFEPRNAVKGDLARMMFYMDIRYNGNDSTGTDDLALVNYTGTSGANLGKLCTLLSWHNDDPVSTEEINRHARIVERQGNRNPFVDYPAWVNDIWSPYCN